METNLMDWSLFLTWMASPSGIPVLVGVVVSVVVEYVPLYSALVPKWKRAVFFVVCLIIPLIAAALGVWTDGWPATWRDTFWPALVAGGLAFASGTMAHMSKLGRVPALIKGNGRDAT
jgi:hypothetical protein